MSRRRGRKKKSVTSSRDKEADQQHDNNKRRTIWHFTITNDKKKIGNSYSFKLIIRGEQCS